MVRRKPNEEDCISEAAKLLIKDVGVFVGGIEIEGEYDGVLVGCELGEADGSYEGVDVGLLVGGALYM